jgi:chorismate mutase
VAEIGRLKIENGMPIHQQSRMQEMLDGRRRDAEKLKLDGQLVYEIFDLIHAASIKTQEDVAKLETKKKKAKNK